MQRGNWDELLREGPAAPQLTTAAAEPRLKAKLWTIITMKHIQRFTAGGYLGPKRVVFLCLITQLRKYHGGSTGAHIFIFK